MKRRKTVRRSIPLLLFGVAGLWFALAFTQSVDAATLFETARGRVLLAVERGGETWYVHPDVLRRYELRTSDQALAVIRATGLGISNADLAAIPRDSDAFSGDRTLRARLAGRILISVQTHGEAWYVHPVDLKRRFLGSPDMALRTLQRLSLGITNQDLDRIPIMSLGPTGSPSISPASSGSIVLDVPFTAQAPFGEWSDPRQQEGCEEASALMAVSWARGQAFTQTEARDAILAMSDWELQRYGSYVDTSAADTADRILSGYFRFYGYAVRTGITTADIRNELLRGHAVIVPTNGKLLGNPNYRNGGPIRHMIFVIGYDSRTDEFVVHDPGTRQGASTRYSADVLASSLQDYATGMHEPIGPARTAMISITKP